MLIIFTKKLHLINVWQGSDKTSQTRGKLQVSRSRNHWHDLKIVRKGAVLRKAEAAIHECSHKKAFCKYAASSKENTLADCDFNKVAKQLQISLRHLYFPVNLLYIFRTPFYQITDRWLLLMASSKYTTEYLINLRKSAFRLKNSRHIKKVGIKFCR